MTTLVERLRDAEGGMHAHCKNDNERYKCDRGSCACAERHVEMLEEAASRIEAQEETIKKLREALESIRLFARDCIDTGHDRGSLGNLYAICDLCDRCAALSDIGAKP